MHKTIHSDTAINSTFGMMCWRVVLGPNGEGGGRTLFVRAPGGLGIVGPSVPRGLGRGGEGVASGWQVIRHLQTLS